MLELSNACVKWLISVAKPQSLGAELSHQGVRVTWSSHQRVTGCRTGRWGKEPAALAVCQYLWVSPALTGRGARR